MEVSEGKGSVKKTTRDPEMSLGIDSLAMLLFGQISATRANRMGIIDVMMEDALTKYDNLLQTDYMPFCCDII